MVMIIALASQFHVYLPWGQHLLSIVLNGWIVCSSNPSSHVELLLDELRVPSMFCERDTRHPSQFLRGEGHLLAEGNAAPSLQWADLAPLAEVTPGIVMFCLKLSTKFRQSFHNILRRSRWWLTLRAKSYSPSPCFNACLAKFFGCESSPISRNVRASVSQLVS